MAVAPGQQPPLPGQPWQVEQLRITTFISEPVVEVQARDWWNQANPQELDDLVVQSGRGVTSITGRRGAIASVLKAERERVTWLSARAAQGADEPRPRLASLGLMPELIPPFREQAGRILGAASCPQSERLAFGAILLRETPSREQGYRDLQPYLRSLEVDPVNTRDLFYQINRRRPSVAVPGCAVNRLSRWAVAEIRSIEVMIDAGGRAGRTHQDGDTITVVRVELDINTCQEFQRQFPREQQHAVLTELLEMGIEISEQGDIP